MVQIVGFPMVPRDGVRPGQAFAAALGQETVFCIQGNHDQVYLLLGHSGVPRASWTELSGPYALLPGDVQLRPVRDKPWAMSWNAPGQPGDIVLDAAGAFLKVEDRHPKRSEFTPTESWIDVATGRMAIGSISGPIFRSWELVCFPTPGRPMVLGTYSAGAV